MPVSESLRALGEKSLTAVIETFMEAFIEAFSRDANAQLTLFKPLSDFTDIEKIITKAETLECAERLSPRSKSLARARMPDPLSPEGWRSS